MASGPIPNRHWEPALPGHSQRFLADCCSGFRTQSDCCSIRHQIPGFLQHSPLPSRPGKGNKNMVEEKKKAPCLQFRGSSQGADYTRLSATPAERWLGRGSRWINHVAAAQRDSESNSSNLVGLESPFAPRGVRLSHGLLRGAAAAQSQKRNPLLEQLQRELLKVL